MYTPEDFEWYPLANCEGYEVANVCGFPGHPGCNYYHIVRTDGDYALYEEGTKKSIEAFGSWLHVAARIRQLGRIAEYYYNQAIDPQPFKF